MSDGDGFNNPDQEGPTTADPKRASRVTPHTGMSRHDYQQCTGNGCTKQVKNEYGPKCNDCSNVSPPPEYDEDEGWLLNDEDDTQDEESD